MIINNYIIFTRFSVVMESTLSAWRISSNTDIETVIKRVLDEKRLRSRAAIFFNYSLPLISRASSNRNIRHVVLTTIYLPKWCRDLFDEAQNKYPWLDVIYVDPKSGYNLNKVINNAAELLTVDHKDSSIISTLRLDDDDLLSEDYFSTLELYMKNEFVDFCISMPRGFRGLFDGENFISFSYENIPNNAYGLAMITRYDQMKKKFTSKYSFPSGTHIDIDSRVPVILDGRKNVYLRTMSIDNDGFSTGDSYVYGDMLDEIRKRHFNLEIDNSSEINKFFDVNYVHENKSMFNFLKNLTTKVENGIKVEFLSLEKVPIKIEMAFYLVSQAGEKLLTQTYSNDWFFVVPFDKAKGCKVVAFCKDKSGKRESLEISLHS